MANPTTNFGWVMPAASNLVTDLPADFDVFGQGVDTSLVDLLGGTTGQVLAKASGTDLDFVWSADAAGMTNPMTTTADIIYSSSGSTPTRLGIGSTAQVLTVASGVPSWATPAASGSFTWAAYTPAYTNLTIGNATVIAQYATSGNVTMCQGQITFGSTTSITGGWSVSLPVNANTDMSDGNYSMPGSSSIACYDTSANLIYAERQNINSSTRFAGVQYTSTPLQVSLTLQNNATTPMTWATGDIFYWNFSYRSV